MDCACLVESASLGWAAILMLRRTAVVETGVRTLRFLGGSRTIGVYRGM